MTRAAERHAHCPVCEATLAESLEWRLVRCDDCGALLVARRADDGGGPTRAYDVRGVRPRTAWRRIEVAWDHAAEARLRSWLAWAAGVTVALALGLLALAWLLR